MSPARDEHEYRNGLTPCVKSKKRRRIFGIELRIKAANTMSNTEPSVRQDSKFGFGDLLSALWVALFSRWFSKDRSSEHPNLRSQG